ncbi:MAG TPA: AAA family ATPase [Candidatus Kapabacteria bacterium]|nr:AAA family ATPase [Candidatus Kapabacteria bacterium]
MQDVIGHRDILSFFDTVISRDRLSHAYCFVGPSHVGKRRVAEQLAATILRVPLEKLTTLPDYTVIEQGINEKTGKTKQNIDIDQMRSLIELLGRRAFLGGYKVALIDEAEKMNGNSANALLKTLEEPKSKTILFLTTTDEKLLPSTILSRCQTIYFHPVSATLLQTFAMEKGVDKDRAKEMARVAHGLPGLLMTWLADPETYDRYTKEILQFISLWGKPLAEKIKTMEGVFESGEDHISTRMRLQDMLFAWELVIRDALHAEEGSVRTPLFTVSVPQTYSVSTYLSIHKRIRDAWYYLGDNIHPRLLIEHILLVIP